MSNEAVFFFFLMVIDHCHTTSELWHLKFALLLSELIFIPVDTTARVAQSHNLFLSTRRWLFSKCWHSQQSPIWVTNNRNKVTGPYLPNDHSCLRFSLAMPSPSSVPRPSLSDALEPLNSSLQTCSALSINRRNHNVAGWICWLEFETLENSLEKALK